jgi:hypothetical protein
LPRESILKECCYAQSHEQRSSSTAEATCHSVQLLLLLLLSVLRW